MKGKQLILLVGVAVVLGGLALWTSREEDHSIRTVRTGEKALPALAVNEVAGITLHTAGLTTTVARTEGLWRVAGKFNYPADFARVRALLNDLAELKVLRTLRTTPEERAELSLLIPADPTATNTARRAAFLELADKDGRALLRLHVGTQHGAQSAGMGMGGYPDGRYIMSEDGTVMLVGNPLPELDNPASEWLDHDFLTLKAADIEKIEVTGSPHGPLRAVKTAAAATLSLQGSIPEGKEADEARLGQLAAALSYLRFEDVADPGMPAAQTGLDQPITYQARTAQGEIYTVQTGKSVGSQRYARVKVAFEPPKPAVLPASGTATNNAEMAGKEAEAMAATAAQIQALNSKLSPWLYLLNASAAESLTMGFTDVLKDKPKPTDENNSEEQKPGGAAASTGEQP